MCVTKMEMEMKIKKETEMETEMKTEIGIDMGIEIEIQMAGEENKRYTCTESGFNLGSNKLMCFFPGGIKA